jgi:hypothetical protein
VPTQVSCPGCNKPLRIADGVTRSWVTCPHCLARVANPQARETDDADRLEVDYEVRRDVRKTSWLLIVLACLGALALLHVAFMVVVGVPLETEALLVYGLGLGVLAALSAAYVLWRRPGRTPLASAGRVVVGTLALVGAITAGTLAVGFAIVVFLFVVCLTGGMKF